MDIILEKITDGTDGWEAGLRGDGFRVIAKTPGMAVDGLVNSLAYWDDGAHDAYLDGADDE